MCMASAVHVCKGLVQCTRVHGQCAACMCSVSAVHVCAWTVQCKHAQGKCSACVCMAGAVHAWGQPVQHSWSAGCLCAHSRAAHACTGSAQYACVRGPCSMGSSAQCPGVQRNLSWGGQRLLTAPQLTQHLLARSEVQRAVPAWKVQEGGVLLPLRRGLRRS